MEQDRTEHPWLNYEVGVKPPSKEDNDSYFPLTVEKLVAHKFTFDGPDFRIIADIEGLEFLDVELIKKYCILFRDRRINRALHLDVLSSLMAADADVLSLQSQYKDLRYKGGYKKLPTHVPPNDEEDLTAVLDSYLRSKERAAVFLQQAKEQQELVESITTALHDKKLEMEARGLLSRVSSKEKE